MLHLLGVLAPIFFLGVLLSGCGALPKTGGPMTNHVMLTIDDQRCVTASRWWLVAITGDINESECQAIRDGRRARDLLRLIEAQQSGQAAQGGKP